MLAPDRSRCRFGRRLFRSSELEAGFLGFWVWKGIRCGSLIGLAADELGVHAGVNASLGDEAFVSAAFDDAAVVEHED